MQALSRGKTRQGHVCGLARSFWMGGGEAGAGDQEGLKASSREREEGEHTKSLKDRMRRGMGYGRGGEGKKASRRRPRPLVQETRVSDGTVPELGIREEEAQEGSC